MEWTYYPSPLLKETCKKVEDIEEALRIGNEMKKILLEKGGVGLAANQVGIDLCMAIVAFEDKVGEYTIFKTLINPKIVSESPEKELSEEGCLSFPELYIDVVRPKKIEVSGYLEGSGHTTMKLKGFQARIFCHEIDHLYGISFVDRLDNIHREMIQGELDKIEKEYS